MSWRASLSWTLLGPSLILLIQAESLAVVGHALGAFQLSRDQKSSAVLVAFAVLVLVTLGQVSVVGWQWLGAQRRLLAELRADLERQYRQQSKSRATEPTSAWTKPSSWDTLLPTARIRRKLQAEKGSAESDAAKAIIEKFGLEPTWALQQLDDNVEIPAARQLTRRAQLADARWAGHATALIFSLALAVVAVVLWAHHSSAFIIASYAYFLVYSAAQFFGVRSATRAVNNVNRDQYYPSIVSLLEVHRFDLYRALGIRPPRDSAEERQGLILEWREGDGSVPYELPGDGSVDPEISRKVDDISEFLRGPEQVGYSGYVSWEIGDGQIELAFAKVAVLEGGNASLAVTGSRKAAFAPFDISANSRGLKLTDTNASVQAPVNGTRASVVFGFRRPEPGTAETDARQELWFEINQLGRFVQLLQVPLPSQETAPTEQAQ